ncbi:EH signature domain-containing protein [Dolichospermum compactum]|jgi:hypothetical protein|uniref:Zorya protein ZorC EH domain-containing protein n=1 Tax=Dolichospermum compactum NIES-806 TaxID=1973481 RepID=A0A1Z4V203_9CYAN|nr:EH signature domain-containing protein [Dolichospermum compactum]BAZ85518.1 hypothetical protein NIES806_17210 [Dolichospermum compactum NIES-806]
MLNKNLGEITPPDYKPHRLITLAKKQKVGNINLDILVLKEKINDNKINEITFVEWIWCIDNDQPWEKLQDSEKQELSLKIWNISLEIEWLYFTLIRRLAWCYSGQKNVIASYLKKSFPIWSKSIYLKDNLAIKILVALGTDYPKQELVKITCNHNLTRNELLNKINNVLPNLPILKDYLLEIAPYFPKMHPITLDKVNWLLRCFDQMEEIIQIAAVEYILNHVSTSIAGTFPELVNWLKQNYNNSQKQSKLSDKAKQKFRDWVGAINYNDFRQLVDLIINRVSITEKEEKQLTRRQGFWANYSNSFMRIKILLPMQSYQIINDLLREDQDVKKLEFDGSDATEICIFDLGDKGFIVEFFRGRGSETRLFPKKDDIERILFGSRSLSVKKIRSLGGEAHDHVLGWQWSCEKLLREKYQILPNTGTTYFIGLHEIYGRYNRGLPELSTENKYKRQEQLQQWRGIINRLESDARRSQF